MCSHPKRNPVGITVHDFYIFDRYAESARHQLCKRRFVTLTVGTVKNERVRLSRTIDVVGEFAVAGYEARIFFAKYSCADSRF